MSEKALLNYVIDQFGTPPVTPSGPLSNTLVKTVDTAFGAICKTRVWQPEQTDAIRTITASGNARLARLIGDMMRIAASSGLNSFLSTTASQVLGITFEDGNFWDRTKDHLKAWDIPGPLDYICKCILVIDNPDVTRTYEADCLKSDCIEFGIDVNSEFRAYSRSIVEVRVMVNDTLGAVTWAFPIAQSRSASSSVSVQRQSFSNKYRAHQRWRYRQ